ncbi:MAG: bifunctional phosphopantothenoylcysteine decarboxylase/phosphopantothenate--cysteine ligase CoaBC [Nitrospirae bacterium]|nr:bifunctional phosphopantothenoylcysteine decarboxylase/phosphopantothenate--cysteine ligase CoaBC [Nitrospirota bacterium]
MNRRDAPSAGELPLAGKRVVLGVTGSIAAYKAADLVRRLREQGAEVRIILSRHALAFVGPLTFQTLSGHGVFLDREEEAIGGEDDAAIRHIALAREADLLLIAPATANLLGKLAHGIADDLLSSTALAVTCPILVAPAMNTVMWQHPAVQSNLSLLQSRGVLVAAPEEGPLACGVEGVGRLADLSAILQRVVDCLARRHDLAGERVLVTAGPTREFLDPVRYLSNRSSGRMGFALAEAARERGAQVVLISGPTTLTPPAGVTYLPVITAEEMRDAVHRQFPSATVLVMAAAVADYRPAVSSSSKLKKTGQPFSLPLEPTPDVLEGVGAIKRDGQIVVGFTAETQDLEAQARDKLTRKRMDLVAANDITEAGAGFDGETNRVLFLTADGEREWTPCEPKRVVAHRLLDWVLRIRMRRGKGIPAPSVP